jgi:small subunit ribosomal protein S20
MASHDSAVKKNRQDQKRRLRNRSHTSRLRAGIKKLRNAIEAQDATAASGLVRETLALVDRTAKHGVIHANAAARAKSRLSRAVAKLQAK